MFTPLDEAIWKMLAARGDHMAILFGEAVSRLRDSLMMQAYWH